MLNPDVPGQIAVEVSGLAKSYGARVATADVSFQVRTGTVTALLGPNGSGKTTTLECCEGYRSPDAGRVRVLGLDPVADAVALRPRVGVLLQTGGIYGGARATEALRHAAAMYLSPIDPSVLVDRLGLGDLGRTAYRRMSGGEQRRLGLALALIGRPELVFLDEPTSGLDPHGARTVWSLLRELRASGVTVVVTTHALHEVERVADEVVVIGRGRVLAAGTPAALRQLPGQDNSRSFEDAYLDLTGAGS